MMKIAVSTGLVSLSRQVDSLNCDTRPSGCGPELIVIHGISLPPGSYGGPWIDRLFTNSLPPDADPYFATIQHLRFPRTCSLRVDGSLTQYVPFHARAWHAGRSYWRGRGECNDFSVGIELEGT